MAAGATLEQIDSPIGIDVAQQITLQVFGFASQATRFGGERDQNFSVVAPSGARFVLKVSNSAEDPAVTDFQTQALLHIARTDPSLPTPRIRPTVQGLPSASWPSQGNAARTVRLLSFLEGEPLHQQALLTDEFLGEIGSAAARLHRSLHNFSHPAQRHELLWDLQHASRLRERLGSIADGKKRALAEQGFEIFERYGMAKLPALPSQVIHNDLNPHNILIERMPRVRVSGIIDLGDAVYAPRVNELAVAAAYCINKEGAPLRDVAVLIRPYHEELRLSESEIAAITPLIIGRLTMAAVISSWRSLQHPENREYILRNAPAAWMGLERLVQLDMGRACSYLTSALAGTSP